ncbi:hypothetical protein EKO27_g3675 [Xylaria grammica]|uniref:Uncharacterized protein n=1 Tax=Xylaria grammica TaxID=363999 RepID=A0A439DAI6_9PEZI|nr:hypothetical protein EKO27_g3675 [Xylaria grammica]
MKVRLVNVDPIEVLADVERRYSSRAHGVDRATARFNTSFHTEREAPDLPPRPSEKPYSFKRWLPLILRSRGLTPSDAQVVAFSRAQARLLLQVADASIPSGAINRIYREDINQEIAPALESLAFPPEGLFMRLDACSAKDGVQKIPGNSALRSAESEEFELFFTPWNGRMRSEREYRVFCPPFRSQELLRISAISQYRWHREWLFYFASDEQRNQVVGRVAEGSDEIRKQIAAELHVGDEMDDLLMRQGLTFDVFYDEEQDLVQLVELNVFGARSACGSCLFQWVTDRKTLEGRGEPNDVEFRVTYQEIGYEEPSDYDEEDDEEDDDRE